MTKIEVVNFAAVLLAVEPLQSLTEDSAQARVFTRMWDPAHQAALTRKRWKFARTTTSTLAQSPNDSDEGYSRWILPANRLLMQGLRGGGGEELQYRIEGNLAIVEEDYVPTAVYATWIQDPGDGNIPAYYWMAMAHELAALAAMPLTENASLAESLRAAAKDYYAAGGASDAQQAASEPLTDEDEMSMLWGR